MHLQYSLLYLYLIFIFNFFVLFAYKTILFHSILGRIVRVNDKVILYRQWVRDTYALQNTQRVIINNYLTTSNISNNVSVSTNTSSRASTVSSGSGSAESVSINLIMKSFKKIKNHVCFRTLRVV